MYYGIAIEPNGKANGNYYKSQEIILMIDYGVIIIYDIIILDAKNTDVNDVQNFYSRLTVL